MFLSAGLINTIQLLLQQQKGVTGQVTVNRAVSGGSINACYQLKADKLYFIKVNNALEFPGMFPAEAEGLKLMRQTYAIHVPEVIAYGNSGTEQFILMDWIESGRNGAEVQASFGRQLAAMHRHTVPLFGLDHSNYMGSLTQSNRLTHDWTDFFITQRLEPQLKIAVGRGFANNGLEKDFRMLFSRLTNLYPKENPALVHGDLWSGNYMINASGETVLIDPAVSYAHREVDIAMSTLFGGFDEDFYVSYNETYPLESGWEGRLDLWNLYPLLVHLNLFGTGYLQQVKSCLRRYL